MDSSIHSFTSYLQQEKILMHYKLIEESDEGSFNKDSQSELQRQSMNTTREVFAKRMGLQSMKDVIPRSPKSTKKENSPITIYDASRPYEPILSNKGPFKSSKDPIALKIFEGLKSSDQFFRKYCDVPPVVTENEEIEAMIHDRKAYNNACWNGSFFQFGDADPKIFKTLADPDIVTHEVGHAITTFSADFAYQQQSGALNEAISDIFAVIHKQNASKINANDPNADWNIAKIVSMGDGQYAPLRSFTQPGKAFTNHPILGDDDQIAHMRDYKTVEKPTLNNDWEYVHRHSGIPNHAFYQAAIYLQGPIGEKIGKIWWQALQNAEKHDDFAIFAQKTIEASKLLYPREHYENAIRSAWAYVGVTPQSFQKGIKQIIQPVWKSNIWKHLSVSVGLASLGIYFYSTLNKKEVML